jgi:predicted O-methyltransferase YrrM
MNFLPPEIEKYAEMYTEPEPPLLQELNRETNLNVLMPRMLSGHLQGRFLSFISKIKQPRYILEIGTYTGYSALCLAEGLMPDGQLHTIDNNEELDQISKKYFDKSVYKEKIIKHTGNALNIIPTLPYNWDLVFIDADKINYLKYFGMVIDKLPAGALILTDNVLWSGKVVASQIPDNDKDTLAIHNFNLAISKDSRVEKLILPIRDGISCTIKKTT